MNVPGFVNVSHHFSASPERVFDAWLDPHTAGKWLFATRNGEMVRVEIDARVGGRYVIVERRGNENVEHTGEYVEIDRPRRLVFTFGVPKYSPLFNRVTIMLAAADSGCDLTLTQEDVPGEYMERNAEGWSGILGALGRLVGE